MKFFGLFQISQVAGNLIAAFLLPSTKNPKELEGPARKLFIIFGSIAGLAVVSFLILRKTPYRPDIDDRPAPSAGQRFIGIFKMFLKKPFLLMVLIIVYSGLSQAYFAGTFTKLIDDSKNVGYVMACFGGTDAIMSVIVGRIMNRVGRKVILFGSALCILIATGMICLIEQTLFKERIWIGIIAAVLCGISDAGMNTLLTATTGSLFEEDPENAFGGTNHSVYTYISETLHLTCLAHTQPASRARLIALR
jgi:MFS family permease